MSVVNSTRETKFHLPTNTGSLSETGLIQELTSGLTQGTGRGNRIGTEIFVKSVDINVAVTPSTTDTRVVRISLVRTLKSEAIIDDTPAAGNVYTPWNRNAFQVYYDELFPCIPDLTSTTDPSGTVQMRPITKRIIQSVKAKAEWFDNDAADDKHGQLILFIDAQGGNADYGYGATVWYLDA